MADSLSVAYKGQVTVTETLGATNDLLFASAGNRAVVHDQFNTSETLNGSSTPAVTKAASFRSTLVAGSVSIDLTSLTSTHGATMTGTGLKVHVLRARAVSGNAAVLTLAKHATNGYSLNSDANWLWSLHPGAEMTYKSDADTGEDIDATHKVIAVAGTGTDAVDITVLMG